MILEENLVKERMWARKNENSPECLFIELISEGIQRTNLDTSEGYTLDLANNNYN